MKIVGHLDQNSFRWHMVMKNPTRADFRKGGEEFKKTQIGNNFWKFHTQGESREVLVDEKERCPR